MSSDIVSAYNSINQLLRGNKMNVCQSCDPGKETLVCLSPEITIAGYSSGSTVKPVVPSSLHISGSGIHAEWNFCTSGHCLADRDKAYGGGGGTLCSSPCCIIANISTCGGGAYNLTGSGTFVINLNECTESQQCRVISGDGALIGCLTYKIHVTQTNGVRSVCFSDMTWITCLQNPV